LTSITAIKRLTPQFAFDLVRLAASHREEAANASLMLRQYTDDIRAEFPNFAFGSARLISSGFHYVVVRLDDAHIFRFPRSDSDRLDLVYEMRLLGRLSGKTCARIPDYRFVSPTKGFGGYEAIWGAELRMGVFRGLQRRRQEDVLVQIAGLVNELHGLPPRLVGGPDGQAPDRRSLARFSHCEFAERVAFMSERVSASLLAATERFFAAHGGPAEGKTRMVHGDLVSNHMLLDSDGRLGVIDFGGAGLGDPAWDFAVLGSYAPWVGPFLLAHYNHASGDGSLLDRARVQAVRYWFDRLFFRLISRHRSDRLGEISAMLRSSLASVGF
jgi:aminoglycoside 2''-phosphotransferase